MTPSKYGVRYYPQFTVGRFLIRRTDVVNSPSIEYSPAFSYITANSVGYQEVVATDGTNYTSNAEQVGVVWGPGLSILTNFFRGSQVCFKLAGGVVDQYIVSGFNNFQLQDPTDVQVITVDGAYDLPANTFCLVAEGSVSFSGITADSEIDISMIGPKNSITTLTGNAKVVTFTISP
jgi:hypothetical protein